jgi:hypothetical protein
VKPLPPEMTPPGIKAPLSGSLRPAASGPGHERAALQMGEAGLFFPVKSAIEKGPVEKLA